MTDFLSTLKDELKSLASSKFAWFLAGVFLSGQDVPSVVASLRTFVGV